MNAYLDHVAVNSANLEETVRFFKEVFHMEVSREAGSAPNRRIWFRQGIQINEAPPVSRENTIYHHVALRVEDKEEAVRATLAYGCKPVEGKTGWIVTADGIVIEFMA